MVNEKKYKSIKHFDMFENNVIDWLKEYFDKPEINEEILKPVLHFSLLWNLFEYTYFTHEKILKTETLINLTEISYDQINEEILDKVFNDFKDRYYTENIFNEKFDSLGLIKPYKECCEKIMKDEARSKKDKNKCLFLIILRFRNNLFHGEKKPETLNIYKEEFKKINDFLMHFINETSKDDSINRNRFNLI